MACGGDISTSVARFSRLLVLLTSTLFIEGSLVACKGHHRIKCTAEVENESSVRSSSKSNQNPPKGGFFLGRREYAGAARIAHVRTLTAQLDALRASVASTSSRKRLLAPCAPGARCPPDSRRRRAENDRSLYARDCAPRRL